MPIDFLCLILTFFMGGAIIFFCIANQGGPSAIGLGIICLLVSIMLIIALIRVGCMPEEIETEEFYTPNSLTAENGNKIQVILAHEEIINVTAMFGAILPEDKIIKRITWKTNYSGIEYHPKPVRYFVVPKEEKK